MFTLHALFLRMIATEVHMANGAEPTWSHTGDGKSWNPAQADHRMQRNQPEEDIDIFTGHFNAGTGGSPVLIMVEIELLDGIRGGFLRSPTVRADRRNDACQAKTASDVSNIANPKCRQKKKLRGP
jgi:hypothetical protein